MDLFTSKHRFFGGCASAKFSLFFLPRRAHIPIMPKNIYRGVCVRLPTIAPRISKREKIILLKNTYQNPRRIILPGCMTVARL